MAAVVAETPTADKRGDGDVEGAAGFFMQFLRVLEEREERGGDADRLFGSAGVEIRDFAAGSKLAELGFQALDLLESFLRRRAQRCGAVAVQHDFESCGHGRQRKAEGRYGAVERWSDGGLE